MTGVYARSGSERDTAYFTFATPHSQRAGGNSDAVVDADIGKSPISRWFAFALNWDDAVSVPTVGMVFDCALPRGTIVLEALVRLDEEFDGTGSDDVDIGDANQTDGWADGIDLTSAVTTTPILFRDVSTDYMAYNDIVAGTAGPQIYYNGGVIRVLIATADDLTQGHAVLFLKSISYNEAIAAEGSATA